MASYRPNTDDQGDHGGNNDPNQTRLHQMRTQQSSANSSSVNTPATEHGGSNDPNQTRLRQAQGYQGAGIPANASPPPMSTAIPPNYPPPTQAQMSASPVYNGYQTPQSPQSIQSASYFTAQNGYQQTYSNQFQQPVQSHYMPQSQYTSYPTASNPSQSPPATQNTITSLHGQSQSFPVKNEASTNATVIEVHAAGTPMKQARERGYTNAFQSGTDWRIKWPNAFKLAAMPRPGSNSRHRDIMQRAKDFPFEDYYLSPADGHLAKLFVQSTQAIYDDNTPTTWRRTFIRNQSPLILRVANWVLHSMPRDDRDASGEDVLIMGLKWIPSCVAILLLMVFPIQASGEVRNNGKYDALPYKFWGYPYHTSNPREGKIETPSQSQGVIKAPAVTQRQSRQLMNNTFNPIMERPVEPKYLCFLRESESVDIREVSQWKKEHSAEPTYIIVSYTSEQFGTEEEQLFLHDVGERAARAAGVKAYWVGCSCLGKNKAEVEDNVWCISDVVRGARGLIIAVSSTSRKDLSTDDTATRDALRQWGTRVWTLPEVLLTPNNSDIQVYGRGSNIDRPMVINKRNFATQWGDISISRELIDHYEGNLGLSSLELVTIALRCLHNRQKGSYLPGDMAYALMGLLRRRPNIVKTDTAFQAFARLSLANDSDLLLERLICVLPKNPNQPWYDMDDQWGASLWDILPSTQVCGIADNDTVIIDGGYAAAIRWKAFAPVANLTKDSWRRFFVRYTFRSTSYLFIAGISLLATGVASNTQNQSLVGLGAFFLVIALCLILASPYIIRTLYTGKLWGTQAWFFGFEGYVDISTIEEHIFGADMGHLKWSTSGSPLSMHAPNKHGECIGQDPCTNPETAEKVRRAIHAPMGEERIFTLVDTYTLTVTMFSAVRPPVAVALCGAEGGMQRALLCSYDWSTQTLYRESVLRMETIVLEQMQRVGRLRIGLRRDRS